MQAVRKTYVTPEAYLAMERQAETKSEYFNGESYAMSGASRQHVIIMVNIVAYLGMKFKGRPCAVFTSDMRVKVSPTGLYTYPDVVVVCGKARFDDRQQDSLLNPMVIFEILSPSTEAYDRGAKFAHYRTLESLSDYILIAQDTPVVEHYARQPDSKWLLSTYNGLETIALLPSIACELPLAEIYDKVEWPEDDVATNAFRIVRETLTYYEPEGTYARRPPSP